MEPLVDELIEIGRFFESKGWAAATSGNYSVRLDEKTILITESGKAKGRLKRSDFMVVDLSGKSLEGRSPSAETLLHTALYQKFAPVNCVLHTHSVGAVVASRLWKSALLLQDYEMLKAFPGIKTHQTQVHLPIFENTQDIASLAELTIATLQPQTPAYLIRNHGLYGWGDSTAQALRVIEAAEYLIDCELRIKALQPN
jgi:methylthioribulose-1-phosphate dehydratase